MKALVYTVDEPERLLELRAAGIDGVFCDRPDVAREILQAR